MIWTEAISGTVIEIRPHLLFNKRRAMYLLILQILCKPYNVSDNSANRFINNNKCVHQLWLYIDKIVRKSDQIFTAGDITKLILSAFRAPLVSKFAISASLRKSLTQLPSQPSFLNSCVLSLSKHLMSLNRTISM